ncbi:hypothetical protein HPB49_007526 [Dermacentor silvarum]|uniref:Uncharacterized protein n=1 Tax=Dermacentor silvarum TaxID=543639 RepID=A0ACB8DWN6_DERSI|nr:immediate early response gene 2 protein [Dermacentor silvarum]KAH7978949.1 hypothetical protein HPB49_007526 [Dermacentor silvarum]
MVMDNDAQKVIAISLGKIATSRVQRGGPSLHRSLLVASVLYKARTTYFDDALQTNGASFSPVMCAPCQNDDEEADCEPEQIDVEEDSSPLAKPNRTVTSPVTSAYEDCASTDGGDDKENVEPPNGSEPSTTSARCLKRRRTHAEDEDSGAKRSRLWRRSSSCDSDESEQDCAPTEEVDAMEVESISNLVLAFNSGLKGLSSSWDNCQPSMEEPQLRRGTSLPDLCSAQSDVLRTPFPPPVLALTV